MPNLYEIRVWFYYLFKESPNSPSTFFWFLDQRCLDLYMREALGLRYHSLHPPLPRPDPFKSIIVFFLVLLADKGTKK